MPAENALVTSLSATFGESMSVVRVLMPAEEFPSSSLTRRRRKRSFPA